LKPNLSNLKKKNNADQDIQCYTSQIKQLHSKLLRKGNERYFMLKPAA